MSERIFSGKSSQKFWDVVNESKNDILYEYGCKAQELESINADLLEACEAQHQAIDRLFALLIEKDEKFFPSKSGQPWEAIQQGNVAIAKAKQGRE